MSTAKINTRSSGVRKPRQARGHSSWERVLDAGAEVLAENGYEGFTLAEVSRRAGVSNGTIYWRFESKEALFAAIQEREIERLMQELDVLADSDDWARLDLKAQLRGVVQELADSFRRRLGLMHTFIARAMVDEPTFERGGRAAARTVALFEQRLATCRAEIRHVDPDAAIRIAVEVLFSSLTQHVATSRSRMLNSDADWERLVNAITDVGYTYLVGGAASSPSA